MGETVRRTIVVSAPSIRKGGTLKILRQCLDHLSSHSNGLRVVAIVHSRSLFTTPGIEYMEMPGSAGHWLARLVAEYVTMHRISRQIAAQDGRKIWMWLSMHDITPRVEAEHREVYCHTALPFMRIKPLDFMMDPKIPLISIISRIAYRVNIMKNDSVIVQQNWFADAFSEMTGYPREKIRVIPPAEASDVPSTMTEGRTMVGRDQFTFLYVSTPDCHKNFETLCKAAVMLEKKIGKEKFSVILTINGRENRYSRWLFRKWGRCSSIMFHGFMNREELRSHYASADCLVFPSRCETWGLPISEYLSVQPSGRLILADLPYSLATSGGRGKVFSPDSALELEARMSEAMED